MSARSNLSDNAVILVVGSDSALCAELQDALISYGVRAVLFAIDEFDALEQIDKTKPDLILLDIALSGMNWLEFCMNVSKGNSETHSIPIIAMTDLSRNDERAKMLKINVSAVIHKPFSKEELIDCVDMYLQKSYLIKKLENDEEPTDDDLEIARGLQYTLLPDDDLLESCRENYNIGIYHLYKASQALGGDYWTVQQLPDGKVMVCVADFAGHGVSVAIDTFRLHNYLKEFVNYLDSPAQILENMNDNFYRILPTGQYLTCFFCIIDTVQNKITYASAAVPPVIMVNSGEVVAFDCSGTPIGAYPKAHYVDKEVEFSGNSSLLIYSDALVEMNGDNQILFSSDSLQQNVRKWADGGSKAIYDGVVKRIEQTNHRFDDDLTIVVLDLKTR